MQARTQNNVRSGGHAIPFTTCKGFLRAVVGRRITELNNQPFGIEDAKYFMAVIAVSFSCELEL